MDEETILDAIHELIQIDVGDGIIFTFQKIESIREVDEYNNFRVHLKASYGKIDAPMKIDITTGDVITPTAIEYSFKLLLEDKVVQVMAYNLETILAEKYETIIRRNIGTTRARDFYDLYVLFNSRISKIQKDDFVCAVENTARQRGSMVYISDWKEICDDIRSEKALETLWYNYQNENNYAAHLSYEAVIYNLVAVALFVCGGRLVLLLFRGSEGAKTCKASTPNEPRCGGAYRGYKLYFQWVQVCANPSHPLVSRESPELFICHKIIASPPHK